MITLQITEAPDCDLIRTYDFLYDSLILGRGEQSNLIITDSAVSPIHLRLSVIDNKLFIKGAGTPYSVNGKKVSGDKFCSIGDEVKIGMTAFKILAFANTMAPAEERLRDAYKEIENTRPDITMLLEAVETELLKLQTIENNKIS